MNSTGFAGCPDGRTPDARKQVTVTRWWNPERTVAVVSPLGLLQVAICAAAGSFKIELIVFWVVVLVALGMALKNSSIMIIHTLVARRMDPIIAADTTGRNDMFWHVPSPHRFSKVASRSIFDPMDYLRDHPGNGVATKVIAA